MSIRSGRFSWLGSRKSSLDSQSIQQTDLDRLQAIYDETVKGSKKRSKKEFFRSHRAKLRPWSRLSSRRNSVTSRASDNSSVFSQVLPAITLDPAKLTSKPRFKLGRVPQPGRSIDFGRPGAAVQRADDPGYQELEAKLRQLATVSRNTEREGEAGVEVAVQTSPQLGRTTVATQVSPYPGRREPQSSTDLTDLESLPPLLHPAVPSPLQHIEANVVNVRVLAPSSEDSSIPSSYEKDFKMRKLSPRGKENSGGGDLRLEMEEISIPALKVLPREGGGALMRPRDHHNRGRRGAIVQKLSPGGGGVADTTATDS